MTATATKRRWLAGRFWQDNPRFLWRRRRPVNAAQQPSGHVLNVRPVNGDWFTGGWVER